MTIVDPLTLDVLGQLLDWRRLAETKLYTGMSIDADMTLRLFNMIILTSDHVVQLAEQNAGQARTLKQMEAIARDLDPTRKVLAFAGHQPRAAGQNGHGPTERSPAGRSGADVVALMPRRLPPRPIYEPIGPGGAA